MIFHIVTLSEVLASGQKLCILRFTLEKPRVTDQSPVGNKLAQINVMLKRKTRKLTHLVERGIWVICKYYDIRSLWEKVQQTLLRHSKGMVIVSLSIVDSFTMMKIMIKCQIYTVLEKIDLFVIYSFMGIVWGSHSSMVIVCYVRGRGSSAFPILRRLLSVEYI